MFNFKTKLLLILLSFT